MKEFLVKWVVPVILVLVTILWGLSGFKFPFLNKWKYKLLKSKKDAEKKILEKKAEKFIDKSVKEKQAAIKFMAKVSELKKEDKDNTAEIKRLGKKLSKHRDKAESLDSKAAEMKRKADDAKKTMDNVNATIRDLFSDT